MSSYGNFGKIEIFQKYRLKWRFFKNVWRIRRIFEHFDRNWDFRKFWPISRFFLKLLTKSTILTKIEICEDLTNITISRKFCPKSRLFENFDQNRVFSKILTKIDPLTARYGRVQPPPTRRRADAGCAGSRHGVVAGSRCWLASGLPLSAQSRQHRLCRIKLRSHGRHAAADKFRRKE